MTLFNTSISIDNLKSQFYSIWPDLSTDEIDDLIASINNYDYFKSAVA